MALASKAKGYLRALAYLAEYQCEELGEYSNDADRAGDLSVYAIAVCFDLDPLRVVKDYYAFRKSLEKSPHA
jgi:hypothetical protein